MIAITLLERSGRFLRTDIRYLLKGGAWLGVGQGVAMAAGFLLSVAFANLVPKEVFGTYKFVFSLAGLFGTFSLTAMGTAVTQAVARGFDGALAQGMRASLRWSLISVTITLGAALYYYINGNNVLAFSLVIVAFSAPLIAAWNLSFSFLKGKKDFRRDTLYGILLSVVPPVFIVGVLLFSENVPLIIAAYFIPVALLSYSAYRRTTNLYPLSGKTDLDTPRYGFNLSAMSILGRVASYIDKILLFHFLGAAPLAVYSFAIAPVQYALRANGIFRTLALPKLAERDIPALKRTLPRKILIHFTLSALVTAAYVLLAPFFFDIFFPAYRDAVIYSQALALLILTAPGVWLGQTLTAHAKTRQLYIINTVSPIMKIGLLLILTPLYGLWGAVAAMLGVSVVGLFMAIAVFRSL